MGFDGFLVPDWAKPYVGYAVGMDWPEGDEDGCFRLADACAASAKNVSLYGGIGGVSQLGDDWDGDALEAFLEHARSVADPVLARLVMQLVQSAIDFNELGVQVQYTKRMIEVSVWFLIFQIGWLLAMAFGPWGGLSLALIGSRVQLTRLVIAQLGKRLLVNVGLFGALLAGMDLAVQASQARRDHLDWEQIMTSAGTGAALGGFLTVFTGLWPARSMWGLMFRSGLASGATDLTFQLAGGEPLDPERLLKNFTSGVVGGADAHWASWSPGSHLDGGGAAPGSPAHPASSGSGHSSLGGGSHPASTGHGSPYGTGSHSTSTSPPSNVTSLASSWVQHADQSSPSPPVTMTDPGPAGRSGTDAVPAPAVVNRLPPDTAARADGGAGPYSGLGNKQDVIPAKLGRSIDSMINSTATADAPSTARSSAGTVDAPSTARPGAGTVDAPGAPRPAENGPASAKPAGLGPPSLSAQATPLSVPHQPAASGAAPLGDAKLDPHPSSGHPAATLDANQAARSEDATAPAARQSDGPGDSSSPARAAAEQPGPFQILDNPGRSGDGYVPSGHWGKYGAAGVLIRAIDKWGVPRYLLMQQSQHVSNAGKWQLPGGALDSLETPVQGAAREISEELGVDQAYLDQLQLRGELPVEAAKGWTYTNLAAEGKMFTPKLDTFEVGAAKWFSLEDLVGLANANQLHPALAKALPDLVALFHKETRQPDSGIAGPKPETASRPETASASRPETANRPETAPRPDAVLKRNAGDDPAPATTPHYTSAGMTSRITPPVNFGSSQVPPPGHLFVPGQADPVPVPPEPEHPPMQVPPQPAQPPLPFSGLADKAAADLAGSTIRQAHTGLLYTGPALHVPMDAPFGARVVGTSFGQAVWGQVLESLPKGEAASVKHYSDNGYTSINGLLRTSGQPHVSGFAMVKKGPMSVVALAHIENLKKALSRQPVPETIDVFRSVRMHRDLFTVPMEELPGTVQRDPAFLSTNIGKSSVWHYDVVMHLRVPEGTPALYLDPISHHAGERELLLGPGRSWFVEDVQRRDHQWHVYGWILPEGAG